MDSDQENLDLEDERTAQSRYRDRVHERARTPTRYTAPANTIFTGTAQPRVATPAFGELAGRVSLVSSKDDLGGRTDYYIGDTHLELDGVQVFSWAAPVATTFYRGRTGHDWCDEVAVIRSLDVKGGQLQSIADDVIRPDAPAVPFPRRELRIPARDSGTATSRRVPQVRRAARPAIHTTKTEPGGSAAAPRAEAAPEPGSHAKEPPVRAETILRARLQAPRTRSLSPVLSTLQPDQYDLVTVAAMDSMIVEGHPGTGKTIIAAHRAAWLVHEEVARRSPEKGLDGKVMLVGPTDSYSDHVRGVIQALNGSDGRVVVLSLPELLRRLLGVREQLKGEVSYVWQDVDPRLATAVEKMIRKDRAVRGRTPSTREVYERLRVAKVPSGDKEWENYLRRLPEYDFALARRAQAPLLAYIRWSVAPSREFDNIEHIIVDEAQDVTDLEWLLLKAINQTEAWTLVGDLNQRRSDHSPASWDVVKRRLDPQYIEFTYHRLKRGYRSTKPILEFANKLLPRSERKILAFQAEGPSPTVTKVRESDLDGKVISEVVRLRAAYRSGSVAVLTVDPSTIGRALRKAGWTMETGGTWVNGDDKVSVLAPDMSRGLEFDGVVVVEPSAFPQNLGRQGPLYTALTRPNRELSIVYSGALPDALRRH